MDAPRTFEWDEAKAESNLGKHGVSFFTAAAAFADPDGQIEPDLRHYGEERYRLFANVGGFPVCVVFTLRGDAVRIISARKANRKER